MRFPLATSLENRAGDLDKDAKMVNAFAEVEGDPATGQRIRAVKRPGFESAFTVATGTGQGLFTWTTPGDDGDDETLVVISDDTLTTSPTVLAKALQFVQQPTDPFLDDAITPAVTVRIVDQAGNTVNSTATVTVSLSTNPTGATLGGDTSNAAVAGIATFNDLELNRSGSGFVIGAASSGLRSAASSQFTLATQLVFTTQPTGGQAGETLDPIEVTAQDLDGNTDTNFTGDVTLSLHSGTPGELDGTLTVAAVAGVASFTNVEISEDGTYTLLAKCTSD